MRKTPFGLCLSRGLMGVWLGFAAGSPRMAGADSSVPDLLFHASFDRTADAADVAYGDPGEVASDADIRARGRQRERPLTEGRFGQALAASRAFEGHGNVSLPRGAVSFWFRQGEPAGQMYYPILELRTVEPYFWWRFLSIHGMHGAVRVELVDRDCMSHMLTLPEWSEGEWQHLVVSWDHLQGLTVYRNGEVAASNWGERTWPVGRMHLEMIHLPAPRGGAYDELRVFSRPLSHEEVRSLFEQNAFSTEPGSAASASFSAAQRREELGWTSLEGVPVLRAAEPLTAVSAGVREARQLKRWMWRGVDGKEGTFFPSNYQGYRYLDGGGYHLVLAEGSRVNHLRITGRFRGEIYAGLSMAPPSEQAPLAVIEPVGFTWQRSLERTIEPEALSLFRRPLDGERDLRTNDNALGSVAGVDERRARLRNLQAFDVQRNRPAQAFTGGFVARPGVAAGPGDGLPAWFDEALVSLMPVGDRDAHLLFRDYRYRSDATPGLVLRALRAHHLFSPATDTAAPERPTREDHLDAISLEWRSVVTRPTALRVEVRDPITPRRELVSFDVLLQEGEGSFALALDHLGVLLPQDRHFWITLYAEHDLAMEDLQVRFHFRDDGEVRAQYRDRQRGWMRDLFMYLSEGRPWGRVETWADARNLGRAYKALGEMYEALEAFRSRFPDEPLSRGIETWTRPNAEHPQADVVLTDREAAAPAWAAYARVCLRQFLAMAHWWVENRQVPNGEFGSGLGDDTDLVQDWPSLILMSDPDGILRDSLDRLSETAWHALVREGLNARVTDTLHAYEDGINVMPHHALIHYGNPVHMTRLMESARSVRERLMGVTGGHLHFRSWYYGTDEVITEGRYGVDSPWNSLMLHPAIWLAYYGGYPYAVETLSEYARSWIEDLGAFESLGRTGGIRFEDHQPAAGRTTGYGFRSLLQALLSLSEAPDVRGFLEQQGMVTRTGPAQAAALDFIESFRNEGVFSENPAYLQQALSVCLEALRTTAMSDDRFDWVYLAWLISGDLDLLADGARRLAERTAVTLPMQTEAEQSADRVQLSKKLIERMYLGGVAVQRNEIFPRHEVSYEGMGPDFAALVTHAAPDALRVQFYNFAEGTLEGRMRVWNLVPGLYEVRMGPWDESRGRLRRTAQRMRLELKRFEAVPLRLPPGRSWGVVIRLLEPGTPLHERADLAIASEEGRFDAEADALVVRIHNLGARPTGAYAVRVLDPEGREIERRSMPSLEPPVDLVPRVADLRIEGLRARGIRSVAIELDPEGRIEEITEVNNRAVFDLRE